MYGGERTVASKDKKNEPRTKIQADLMYAEWLKGGKKGPNPRKPKPKPKEEGAVSKFGKYLKGTLKGGTMKDVDKYFAEKWKQRALKKEIEEKKKKGKIKRLKAEGRKKRQK
jgi:hypothetical protein